MLNVLLAHGGGDGAGIAQDVGVTWALLPLASIVLFTARVNRKIRREIEERGEFENAVRALEQEYREEVARGEGIKA